MLKNSALDHAENQSIWVLNGSFGAYVHPYDRGFAYGDGVFTTVAWRNDKLEFLDAHLQRLHSDTQKLNIISADALIREELDAFIERLKRLNIFQGIIKIIISRGVSQRGYGVDRVTSPTRMISYQPLPEQAVRWMQDGIGMRVCTLRLTPDAVPGVKHLNRLQQVLARAEWHDASFQEGLLLNENAHLIEAIAANIFWIKNGTLCTPDLSRQGVHGVLRQQLIQIAAVRGIKLEQANYPIENLLEADEVFISNSVLKICPVLTLQYAKHNLLKEYIAGIEDERTMVKNWPIGKMTRQLQQLLNT